MLDEWKADNEGTVGVDAAGEEDEDDPSSGMQQEIIDLVGVDTVRISNFIAENNLLLSKVINLGLTLNILIHLLGWAGVYASLLMPILLTPLNL